MKGKAGGKETEALGVLKFSGWHSHKAKSLSSGFVQDTDSSFLFPRSAEFKTVLILARTGLTFCSSWERA